MASQGRVDKKVLVCKTVYGTAPATSSTPMYTICAMSSTSLPVMSSQPAAAAPLPADDGMSMSCSSSSSSVPPVPSAQDQQLGLWIDNYWLTRQVIVDAASKSQCLSSDLNSLYQNGVNLGLNFTVLTGIAAAGNQLAAYLKVHINLCVQIVNAVIAGRSVEALNTQWKQNAAQIAKVYNRYNVSIRLSKITSMLLAYLQLTLAEVAAIIKKNCALSGTSGDAALVQAKTMAMYINSKF